MNENEIIENVPEPPKAKSTDDSRDLELMEIEVYRQYWNSLNIALAEIKALRGNDVPEIDPVEYVKHEVSNLKNQFSELKELISGLQNQQAQQAPQRYQAVPAPMPVLPYYQTPNYAPIMQMPQ